jgi:hypothetical protein
MAAGAVTSMQGIALAGPAHPVTRATASRINGPIPTANSLNWAGYVDTNNTVSYTNAAATFTVPTINCSKDTFTGKGFTRFLVGLDGYINASRESAGFTASCNGSDSNASYSDWYQMYPAKTVTEHPLNAGDVVSAYVERTSQEYLLSVVDATDPTASFAVILPCTYNHGKCTDTSAEVIAQADPGCTGSVTQTCNPDGFFPLPDFGTENVGDISDAVVHLGGSFATSAFTPVQLTMADSTNTIMAQVTTPVSNDAFAMTWEAPV